MNPINPLEGHCKECGRPPLETNVIYATATLDIKCHLDMPYAQKLEHLPADSRNCMFRDMKLRLRRSIEAEIDVTVAQVAAMQALDALRGGLGL